MYTSGYGELEGVDDDCCGGSWGDQETKLASTAIWLIDFSAQRDKAVDIAYMLSKYADHTWTYGMSQDFFTEEETSDERYEDWTNS